MKKFLAILLSVMMLFTMVSGTVFAATEETTAAEEEVTVVIDETKAELDTLIATFKSLIVVIHELVGNILAAVDEECPFCEEYHDLVGGDEAEEETTEDEFANGIEDRMDGALEAGMSLFDALHTFLGEVLAMLGESCFLCGTVHGATDPATPEAEATTEA